MFYIRSMKDESRKSGVQAPEGFTVAVSELLHPLEGGRGSAQTQKRIYGVEYPTRATEKTNKQFAAVEYAAVAPAGIRAKPKKRMGGVK
jgi:hypothetical protein